MARSAKAQAASDALSAVLKQGFGMSEAQTQPLLDAFMDNVELGERLEKLFEPGGRVLDKLNAIKAQTDKLP